MGNSSHRNYLFTSESVTEGHPDKVADQISDAILDACLEQDPYARVGCETLVTAGKVILAGEIHRIHRMELDIRGIVREVLNDIGYDDPVLGFDSRSVSITDLIQQQTAEINAAVGRGGAGDQGLMFGYACDETPELMPLPITLAHKIAAELAHARKSLRLPWLRPDGKTQVTVEYREGMPYAVKKVVLAAQHDNRVSQDQIRTGIISEVIHRIIPMRLLKNDTEYLVNTSGSFQTGGPAGDTGLTGRKIIMDTYGGSCPHGGGAFSGKDPSKVDRSAAYAARYIAKNFVAAGVAGKCKVQLSYAIGKLEPVSVYLDFQGTGKIPEHEAERMIQRLINLSPRGIIHKLDLLRPIYRKTTNYGHFGRELPEFTWEHTDLVEEISKGWDF